MIWYPARHRVDVIPIPELTALSTRTHPHMGPPRSSRLRLPATFLGSVLLTALLSSATPAPTPQGVFETGVTELGTHYYGPSTTDLAPLIEHTRASLQARCTPQPSSCTLTDGYDALSRVTTALADRHTGPLEAAAYERLTQASKAITPALPSYGIVAVLFAQDQALVKDVMVGSPAEQAGIQPGDRLIHLRSEGTPRAADAGPAELFGDPEKLTVQVARGPVDHPQVRTVTLESRPLQRITLPVLYTPPNAPAGVQVLRIPSFLEQGLVGARVHALVHHAQQAGTKALIVDLRGGPGGKPSECLTAAGAFVGPTRLIMESRRGQSSMGWDGQQFQAQTDPVLQTPDQPPPSSPIMSAPARWTGRTVVLVNASTASCHEAMAHLLQQAGAPVLGLPTRGVLHTLAVARALPGGGVLMVSAYRVLDSSGRPLPARVTPDEPVFDDPQGLMFTGEDLMLKAAYASPK